MNLNKTFFKPENFDFIISNGVLHHTLIETSFKNLLPLLKPGGYINRSIPLRTPGDNLRQFAKYLGDSLGFLTQGFEYI